MLKNAAENTRVTLNANAIKRMAAASGRVKVTAQTKVLVVAPDGNTFEMNDQCCVIVSSKPYDVNR